MFHTLYLLFLTATIIYGFEMELCKYRYDIGDEIGSGTSGIVYKAQRIKKRSADYAIKVMNSTDTRQIELLNVIGRHTNIVRVFCTAIMDNQTFIVIEYCPKGDLATFMKQHGIFTEKEAVGLLKQLNNGLQHLHRRKIVHRDIKPSNLMLSAKGTLKIADFDVAEKLAKNGTIYDSFPGTPLYAAPEVHFHEPHSTKADLWSAGIILYQLLTGKHPFLAPGENINMLIQNTMKQLIASNGVLQLPSEIEKTPKLMKLQARLLRFTPKHREFCYR